MVRLIRIAVAANLFLMTMAVSFLHAQEQFGPHLRFVKGDTQHIDMTLRQTIDQVVKDAGQHAVQTTVIGFTIGVDEIDRDGTAAVSVRFESVGLHAQGPGGPVDYESASPPGQVPAMASGLAALVGQTYSAKIDAHGSVKQVDGLPAILESVLSRLNLPEGVARIAAEKVLRQEFDEQNLTQNLQNLFSPLPDHGASIGESWARTAQVKLGLPLTVQSTYTLLSRTAGVATIEVTGSVATPHDAAMDLGTLKLSYDLHGEQNGSLQIVESTGQTQSSEISQHLSGSATLRGPNTDPQTVPLTIESTMKIERK